MGESQSRYSIVERLTSRKLDVMTSKFQLADEIKKAEQHSSDLETTIKDKKETLQLECDSEKKVLDREIESQRTRVTNLKERQEDKEENFDEKLLAIDEALKKLEEISKSTD